MFTIKYKLLTTILLSMLIVLPLVMFVPSIAKADHDSCSGSADALERCIQTKRDAANERCFLNNPGNNNAVSSCVDGVTSHFTSGSPASAPPLPAAAAPPSSGGGSNIVNNADCKVDPSQDLNEGNCRIIYWINVGINALSVLVGIVVTAMIILGGIRYTAAGAEPNAVAAAKKQVFNAIFALVIYGLMYALLQYLIPGGQF